jgi:DICT domain-containing protein
VNLHEFVGIGDVAHRTGVAVSTLRAWEARYGFPQPVRLPGGHRRYSPLEIDAVRQVLRERDNGESLAMAIARAKVVAAPNSSVMAALRRSLPELEPRVLSRRSMLALSRAIEDEIVSDTADAMLFGAFQRASGYRAAERRWRRLAAGARFAVVLASFPRLTVRGSTWEVPLLADVPLRQEWVVLCDSARFSACLVGTASRAGHPSPSFEALWTVEPPAVRDALRAAMRAATLADPSVAALGEPPRLLEMNPVQVVRNMTRLTNRATDYLAVAHAGARRARAEVRAS